MATNERVPADRIARWRRALAARTPIVGPLRRRLALAQLIRRAERPEVVALLATALASPFAREATRAREALAAVKSARAIDALCEAAIADPTGGAARLCIERRVRPRDDERACLFLFVTGQLDAYFDLDFEFQNLRLEFDRAPAEVRRRVLRVLRSGDRRCLPFFAERKPLVECTEPEIAVALRSFLRHQDWPRLWRACLELPLRHGLPYLARVASSDWRPDEPEARSALAEIARDVADLIPPSARTPPAVSEVFDSWIRRGRTGTLARLPLDELFARLDAGPPPEAVAVVGALSRAAGTGSAAAQRVERHPHWLVRLAGHVTGLCARPDLDEIDDDIWWVRRLAPEYPALQVAPARATPALLDVLESAPDSAWKGPLGAARRVLRTLLAHRVTAGTFEEMVVEIEAFDGEFVPMAEEPVDETEETR